MDLTDYVFGLLEVGFVGSVVAALNFLRAWRTHQWVWLAPLEQTILRGYLRRHATICVVQALLCWNYAIRWLEMRGSVLPILIGTAVSLLLMWQSIQDQRERRTLEALAQKARGWSST